MRALVNNRSTGAWQIFGRVTTLCGDSITSQESGLGASVSEIVAALGLALGFKAETRKRREKRSRREKKNPSAKHVDREGHYGQRQASATQTFDRQGVEEWCKACVLADVFLRPFVHGQIRLTAVRSGPIHVVSFELVISSFFFLFLSRKQNRFGCSTVEPSFQTMSLCYLLQIHSGTMHASSALRTLFTSWETGVCPPI